MNWRIVKIIAVVLLLLIGAYTVNLAIPRDDYFIERSGELIDAELIEEQRSVDRSYSVRLTSSTGLKVNMRVLRPEIDVTEQLPLVLVLGGQTTGKDAIDLVGNADGIAFAAIDYPYDGDQELDGFWQSVSAIPSVQRAFLDTPPAISLALTWLLQQDWVDPARTEIAGVSLGVPFATVAGAIDQRFSRVWILHGGGDNVAWVTHGARRHIDNEFLRGLTARAALFAVHGRSFDTRRWIPEIAPRPLIIVAARDDDFVPPEAQEPLVRAAQSKHVELIWTEGRHIRPSRGEELQQLLDIVRDRILGVARRGRLGPVHPIEPLDWSGSGDGQLVTLPALSDSDAFLRLELVDNFGAQLDVLLSNEAIVEKIVATIDNLPRSHVAERLRPIGRISGAFSVDAEENGVSIQNAANFDRYRVLVDMLVLADPDRVADLYRRYYPLFQEAYVALGYPDAYFNDRVIEVIEHLLETPVPPDSLRLVRPHVLYEFENPDYEALSSGQKLLLRIGTDHAAQTKRALEEFRARISQP